MDIQTPRQNDFFLMDVVMRSELPANYKEIFNRVRINMRLLTASDVVVADSTYKILLHISNGIHCRKSKYYWPQKQHLPKKWQNMFNDVIRNIIREKLRSTPLGKWESDGHKKFHYGTDANGIVLKNDGKSKIGHEIDFDSTRSKIFGIKIIHEPPQFHFLDNTELRPMNRAPKWMKQIWRYKNGTRMN